VKVSTACYWLCTLVLAELCWVLLAALFWDGLGKSDEQTVLTQFLKSWLFNLALLPSVLLALAHLTTSLALLTFGARVGGYPVHIVGLMIYLVTVALSLVVMGAQFSRPQPASPTFANLVWVSIPALVSLALLAMFWLTPYLGGAPYAPYDPADWDGVRFFTWLFAIAFATTAVLCGSFKYGLSAYTVQVLVYFGTYSLPHWFRYPEASLLGIHPAILGEVLGIYVLAFGMLFVQAKLKWPLSQDVGPAALVTNLVGALVLYHL